MNDNQCSPGKIQIATKKTTSLNQYRINLNRESSSFLKNQNNLSDHFQELEKREDNSEIGFNSSEDIKYEIKPPNKIIVRNFDLMSSYKKQMEKENQPQLKKSQNFLSCPKSSQDIDRFRRKIKLLKNSEDFSQKVENQISLNATDILDQIANFNNEISNFISNINSPEDYQKIDQFEEKLSVLFAQNQEAFKEIQTSNNDDYFEIIHDLDQNMKRLNAIKNHNFLEKKEKIIVKTKPKDIIYEVRDKIPNLNMKPALKMNNPNNFNYNIKKSGTTETKSTAIHLQLYNMLKGKITERNKEITDENVENVIVNENFSNNFNELTINDNTDFFLSPGNLIDPNSSNMQESISNIQTHHKKSRHRHHKKHHKKTKRVRRKLIENSENEDEDLLLEQKVEEELNSIHSNRENRGTRRLAFSKMVMKNALTKRISRASLIADVVDLIFINERLRSEIVSLDDELDLANFEKKNQKIEKSLQNISNIYIPPSPIKKKDFSVQTHISENDFKIDSFIRQLNENLDGIRKSNSKLKIQNKDQKLRLENAKATLNSSKLRSEINEYKKIIEKEGDPDFQNEQYITSLQQKLNDVLMINEMIMKKTESIKQRPRKSVMSMCKSITDMKTTEDELINMLSAIKMEEEIVDFRINDICNVCDNDQFFLDEKRQGINDMKNFFWEMNNENKFSVTSFGEISSLKRMLSTLTSKISKLRKENYDLQNKIKSDSYELSSKGINLPTINMTDQKYFVNIF